MPYRYETPRRSIYDRLSERRIAAEMLAAASAPRSEFVVGHAEIIDAWVWLPSGFYRNVLSWKALAAHAAPMQQSAQLKGAEGQRRRFCRIATAPGEVADFTALGRATQLLKAFVNGQGFTARSQWSQTQVVLFAPADVDPDTWREAVMAEWPGDAAAQSYEVASGTIDNWFRDRLADACGAEYLVCLSVDSAVTSAGALASDAEEVLGECVAALSLRRVCKSAQPANRAADARPVQPDLAPAEEGEPVCRLYLAPTIDHPPRSRQPRKHTGDLERLIQQLCEQSETQLEQCAGMVSDGLFIGNRLTQLIALSRTTFQAWELLEHVVSTSALAGRVGHSGTVLSQICLAHLLAVNSQPDAILVLDRYADDRSSAWLVKR
ncbi:hypothetical protein [Pseudomonas huanghezhanensis]|uniref:hypothetical protein n=1 Tax=Pseudomonas huanghezhanensis TaxID=3002903 RepID=UPI0022853EB9|nr:hypothetical protein [Pseudomonas sp. BSw22131]